MADRAPGQDAPKHEASCYNCGSKDHFVFACPEPTRSQPAGLEAFRQRQAANQMKGSSGNASHGNRSKGPIITRYGPPPGTGPSPPGYGPWMNGPPPPGAAPYPQPTPPGLPPQPVAFPPPPHGPPTPYSPYPPGPPQQSGYGPGYSPPIPTPVYSSQYGPPPPPPQATPLPYGQPAPYGPPAYNQYPPQTPAYPPTPQPYYSGPSPPAYPPYAPPPPSNYQPGPYTPPSGPPYTPDSQYPPSLPPPPPTHWNQGPNTRNQHHNRGSRHNKDHRGRGPRHHGQQRASSDNNRRSASAAKDSPAPSNSTPKSDHRDEHTTPIDDDFEWELEKIFVEVKTKDADPVGRPLPPEYNDDPTIPPAFDAKCMKSDFFSETDPKGFSVSIRDTKYWTSLRDDPSFKHYRGMITKRFPDHSHEYSVYDLSHLQSEPLDEELHPTASAGKSKSKRSIEETHDNQDWRDPKRRKPLYHEERRSRESSPHLTALPRSSIERDVTDALFHSLDEQGTHSHARDTEDRPNGPHNSTLRQDSGYQSAQSGERRQEIWRERPGSQTSPSQRDRQRSRSSSRPRSRDRSPGARKMPSYSQSYDHDASDSDDSSQMSDMDYELLGLDRPAKKEKKKESKPTIKRRRVKVNDAFSRRW